MKIVLCFVALSLLASASFARTNDGFGESPAACSPEKYRSEIQLLVNEMNQRTESVIRQKMNSIRVNDVVLGYQEKSMQIGAGWLHFDGNRSYQDNTFTVRSNAGDEYKLEYWDIMSGLRYHGNYDVFKIRYEITASAEDVDVNFHPQSCRLTVSRMMRGVPLMLANLKSQMGYYVWEKEAEDTLTVKVPLK